MTTTHTRKRRGIVSILAITAAAAALTLGGALGANAATGHANFGVRNLVLVPASPATDFSAVGTTGTVKWNGGDGTAQSNAAIVVGDTTSRQTVLPQGLEFAANACAGFTAGTSLYSETCTLSADHRTLSYTATAIANGTVVIDANGIVGSYPVVSTGPISGDIVATFTPWTGTTTQAPQATLHIDTVGTPILNPAVAGGVLAAGALGACGVVLLKRRTRAAA